MFVSIQQHMLTEICLTELLGLDKVDMHKNNTSVAYLGYGRHGTCHGRHFDGGGKISLAKN